jgi:cytochrome c556
MISKTVFYPLALAALLGASAGIADEDPGHVRHELMEDVRDAAKPVGQMLRGEADFDSATLMNTLGVFQDASAQLGGLFPEGSEGGEAAPAIWEDRAGFEAAIAKWQEVVGVAIDANPQSLEDAKPVVGPVFQACKGCHDNYRIEEEE